MKNKISNELKTGIAVLVAGGILVMMMVQTGALSFSKNGYTVKTRFGQVAGLKKAAPVRLSGVEIGEVQKLTMIYEEGHTIVEAELWVEQDVKLRKDSKALVSTLGLMGEKYVEIDAGNSKEYQAPCDYMDTDDPVTTDELMALFMEVGDNLDKTLTDVRKLVNNSNSILDDNKPKIGKIIDNIEITTEYFSEFAEDVKYHPWKVLMKGKQKSKEELEKLRAERNAKRLGIPLAAAEKDLKTESQTTKSKTKTNFSSKRR